MRGGSERVGCLLQSTMESDSPRRKGTLMDGWPIPALPLNTMNNKPIVPFFPFVYISLLRHLGLCALCMRARSAISRRSAAETPKELRKGWQLVSAAIERPHESLSARPSLACRTWLSRRTRAFITTPIEVIGRLCVSYKQDYVHLVLLLTASSRSRSTELSSA